LHVLFNLPIHICNLESSLNDKVQFRSKLVVNEAKEFRIFCQSEIDLFFTMFINNIFSRQFSFDIFL